MLPNSDWFIVSLIFTALLLFIEHWIPIGPKKYHVIFNYVLGVLAIFAGMTLYFVKTGRSITMLEAWAFPIVGGAAVIFAYSWDLAMNLISRGIIHGKPKGQTPRTED